MLDEKITIAAEEHHRFAALNDVDGVPGEEPGDLELDPSHPDHACRTHSRYSELVLIRCCVFACVRGTDRADFCPGGRGGIAFGVAYHACNGVILSGSA